MGELQDIRSSVQAVLRLDSDDLPAIDYLVTLTVINTWSDDPEPVWGYLVGPPGSGKTELLRTLDGWEHSYAIDELTENSLASGHSDDDNPNDPSLLPLLDGKILVVKDFSTFSGQNQQTLHKILSVLRAAYDGTYSKSSGKVGLREYKCKFGIIAATTPTIDQFLHENQKLGERFILLRIRRNGDGTRADRTARLRHGRDRMVGKAEWRAQLRLAVQSNLLKIRERCSTIKPTIVQVSDMQGDALDNLADLICRLRTTSVKGQPVEAEAGFRLVQQLTNMARARAAASNRLVLDNDDVDFARRLSHDTLPRLSYNLFRLLWKHDTPIKYSTDQLSKFTGASYHAVDSILDQWLFLQIVSKEDRGVWTLTPDTRDQITASSFFQEEQPHVQS